MTHYSYQLSVFSRQFPLRHCALDAQSHTNKQGIAGQARNDGVERRTKNNKILTTNS